MKKIVGLIFIILGIFLEVTWLGICFGSVIIGILLLIFAPRILFFPFTFFLLIGLRLIYAKAFSDFENTKQNGGSYRYSYSSYTNGNSGSYQQSYQTVNKMAEYYAELESNERDDFATIKKNYRRLMKEHHYDSLVSKGLPKDILEFSEAKTKRLNEAYAAIKEVRG